VLLFKTVLRDEPEPAVPPCLPRATARSHSCAPAVTGRTRSVLLTPTVIVVVIVDGAFFRRLRG